MSIAQQAGFMSSPGLGARAAAVGAAVLSALKRGTLVPRACSPGKAASSLAIDSRGGARLALARREVVVLSGRREQTLVCETGEVWVTLELDSTDYILKHGERLVMPAQARAIVTASATSVVAIAASPPGAGGDAHGGGRNGAAGPGVPSRAA